MDTRNLQTVAKMNRRENPTQKIIIDLIMNDIINIIEADHDAFTVEKDTTRLSDAIDHFKTSETNVLVI